MSKIFNKSYSGKIQFIGDFESFYKSDSPWNQDLEGKHLIKEYLYSRKNILTHLSKLNFKSLADIGCGYGKFTNEIKLRFLDKYLYFNIFMNKSHEYGEKHFRNGELFSKYMVEKYNLYLALTSNKKIGDNHSYEVIFDVNKKY